VVRLFFAAGVRSFTVAMTGVLLGLYFAESGAGPATLGLVVGAGAAGSAAGTAALAWRPAWFHPRPTLVASALLSGAGLVVVSTASGTALLAVAAFAGMVNGMGRDRGPAQALEQSHLADRTQPDRRTAAFTRYALIQDIAGAAGAFAAGVPALLERESSLPTATGYRWTLLGAAALLLLSAALYGRATGEDYGARIAEPQGRAAPLSARSRRRLTGLSALFALDSLGGGFLAGAIISYWFFQRFGLGGEVLGPVFFGARVLNAASFPVAAFLAQRIGLVRTMVFTHLPSSLVLLALPLVPSAGLAIGLFLVREALVQMDVPTRQSYVAAVTLPGERTYAMAVTGLVRNVGWALGPAAAGVAIRAWGLGAPLFLGAVLKVAYDLSLYGAYRGIRPSEEEAPTGGTNTELTGRP
jgi:predicted MFS family arabinose efflux permease